MTDSELTMLFSGGTSGGTWIVKFRRIAASRGDPNFWYLVEMTWPGASWCFRTFASKWLKRPLLYH
jgi:hypothetical protein